MIKVTLMPHFLKKKYLLVGDKYNLKFFKVESDFGVNGYIPDIMESSYTEDDIKNKILKDIESGIDILPYFYSYDEINDSLERINKPVYDFIKMIDREDKLSNLIP